MRQSLETVSLQWCSGGGNVIALGVSELQCMHEEPTKHLSLILLITLELYLWFVFDSKVGQRIQKLPDFIRDFSL